MASDGESSAVDEQALDWFVRLRDEPVPDSARAAFAAWRLADPAHARAYDELAALWAGLDGVEPDASLGRASIEEAGAEAGGRHGDELPRRRKRARLRYAALPAAAIALAAASYGVSAPPGGVAALLADARTAPGETRALTLPDGTHVRLAGGSALSYDISARERRVRMIAGRAFFEISPEHARPFRVVTADAEIRDIGTAFEVAAAPGRSSVAVASGAVEVTLDGGRAASLHAGQRIAFGSYLGPVEAVAPRDVAAWRAHRMVFDKARLSDVLNELEGYGAGRIILLDTALGEKRLTGVFDTRRPREALASVAGITGARVTTLGPLTFVRAR